MTDNFQNYKELINLTGGLPDNNDHGNLDKYYVIELMRRGKDRPDLPAANYHFKNYYIYSWKDLNRYEPEIKDICKLLSLRAYASVNYKLMSQVALDTMAESARRIAAHDYKRFYSIFESCSGRFVDKSNSLWVIDFDNVDKVPSDIVDYIDSMRSGFDKNVIFHMPTKSGIHLIYRPFNLAQFNKEWRFNFDIPDVKKNHLTLLFEDL